MGRMIHASLSEQVVLQILRSKTETSDRPMYLMTNNAIKDAVVLTPNSAKTADRKKTYRGGIQEVGPLSAGKGLEYPLP